MSLEQKLEKNKRKPSKILGIIATTGICGNLTLGAYCYWHYQDLFKARKIAEQYRTTQDDDTREKLAQELIQLHTTNPEQTREYFHQAYLSAYKQIEEGKYSSANHVFIEHSWKLLHYGIDEDNRQSLFELLRIPTITHNESLHGLLSRHIYENENVLNCNSTEKKILSTYAKDAIEYLQSGIKKIHIDQFICYFLVSIYAEDHYASTTLLNIAKNNTVSIWYKDWSIQTEYNKRWTKEYNETGIIPAELPPNTKRTVDFTNCTTENDMLQLLKDTYNNSETKHLTRVNVQ